MKNKILAAGLLVLASAAATGCTPENASASDDVRASTSEAAVTTQAGVPTPGAAGGTTKSVALNVPLVVAGMKTVQKAFYNGKTYAGQKGTTTAVPPGFNQDEARQCLNACPAYYSDIMCHYYCWQPSYTSVSPNIRGCFTNIARGSYKPTIGQDLFYPQIYDYCTYQPFDAVTNPPTGVAGPTNPLTFNPATIAANKAKGNKVGVNKWVDDNERDAFRHVVFTWYDPMLFTVESQQEALNEFYGVKLANKAYAITDTADVAACAKARRRTAQDAGVPNGLECSTKKDYAGSHSRHPNWAAIEAFMNSKDPSLQ